MTMAWRVADLARPARIRRFADDALTGLPVALLTAAIAWRAAGTAAAVVAAIAGLALVAAIARARAARLDRSWLIRQLDTRRADVEDSADLLFADVAGLAPLARLQRDRLDRRLARESVDLRARWSTRRIGLVWLASLAAIIAVLVAPAPLSLKPLAPATEDGPIVPGVPRLVGQRVRVVPPAYTRQPARDVPSLDVRAPQGSRLEWTLSFAPQPATAALIFADGGRVPLIRAGDVWVARRQIDRSALYRVVPRVAAGQAPPRLHRIDAIVDLPPQVEVVVPNRSLSLYTPGQRRWPLQFEARDDYGVATGAELRLTIAEGDGENVKFREQTIALRGSGTVTVKRFAAALDLTALKFAVGSDLIAQLVVRDTRTPTAQVVRSPSVILRWSAIQADGAAMDGVVIRALPAYFRSQRQIIIDAEALIKARPRLAADGFLERSDTIGADQRLLRLRYGKFLGEEQEDKTVALPTADAPAADATGKPVRPTFGSESDALADYGHVHDESEAATLIDPDTRATLKGALDAMWQSELNLRQGKPQAALPFAYTALKLIKQVQQATRIFLARVGPDLPPIDETRRLTGKRDGLDNRDLPAAAASPADPTLAAAWRTLAEPGAATTALAGLETWLSINPGSVSDPLAIAAAIDAVRNEPDCSACRRTLRGLIWSALSRPAPGVVRREASGAAGRRYLDGLRSSGR